MHRLASSYRNLLLFIQYGPPSRRLPSAPSSGRRILTQLRRYTCKATSGKKFQVSIVGGINSTAQSLALLLKEHPLISRLVLYDISKSAFGLGLDLSHIPSMALVEGRAGHMGMALRGSDIVVLACGDSRKTGQTDYDSFKVNAPRILNTVEEISEHCPKAFIVDLSGPINYTVPLISEVLKAGETYNAGKVFGVTGTDGLRAQACLNLLYQGQRQKPVHVPVICGHSATTSVPLLSHIVPWFNIDACGSIMITEHVRNSEHHVVALKRGSGQSNHLNAFAGLKTVAAILNALRGFPEKHIAFVANNDYGTKYFAGPVHITKDGVSEIAGYKYVRSIEAAYLQDAVDELIKEVNESEEYFKTTITNKGPSKAKQSFFMPALKSINKIIDTDKSNKYVETSN